MSRSYGTEPNRLRSRQRLARQRNESQELPRIVVRKAERGFIHPLSKKLLLQALPEIPIEYVGRLREIELRQHQPSKRAFALYRPGELKIIIFSCPRGTWIYEELPPSERKRFRRFGAIVEQIDTFWTVDWPRPANRAAFYFFDIFLHELGHHYVFSFPRKRKVPADLNTHERLADLRRNKLRRILLGANR